jgi:hypothetical protein
MPLSTAEFFRPPPDAMGPVDAWGPTRYVTPGPQAGPEAGRPGLPVRRPGRGPYPGGAAPRGTARSRVSPPAPRYDPGRGHDRGQSPLTPGDRPEPGQRRLYGLRNDAQADGGDLGDGGAGLSAGQVTTADDRAAAIKDEAWDEAAAIRRAAEQEAAAIRQQAESRAAAIRQAAERDAAELRSELLAISGELGRAAAYVTQNLATPGSSPAAVPGGPGAGG